MGAVCYKPKEMKINKEDILKVLQEKSLKDTITEPLSHLSGFANIDSKTLKSENEYKP